MRLPMAANALGEDVMDSQREGGGLAFRGVHLFTSHIRQRSKTNDLAAIWRAPNGTRHI
jgi:hypothetical protein